VLTASILPSSAQQVSDVHGSATRGVLERVLVSHERSMVVENADSDA